MAAPLDQIEAELLALSAEDRARLAERLIASLEDSEEDLEVVERAWLNEAERRYQLYLRGQQSAHPAADVLARVREALKEP